MEFQVGEKVVYPTQGIGVVESIQSRTTSEGRVSGYALRFLSDDSRVFVPRASAHGIGLRPMVTKADAGRILAMVADGTVQHRSNWKGRFKENTDRMRTGSLFDVAAVLKALASLRRTQVLSFRERRMFERAKFLIVSEIAEVEGKSRAVVERRVEEALARTLDAEPRPARQKPVGRKKPVHS